MIPALSRLRAKLASPVAPSLRIPVTSRARQRHPLVMTLLVRNEADVIRQNIEFHMDHGVDHIIATDNNSEDGTAEILEEYARSGVLHLIHEPGEDFDQPAWVNRMGELATTRYGARLLIHADADEFWWPDGGNLKDELLAHPLVDLLQVPLVNVLLEDRGGVEAFPADARYAVIKPWATADLQGATELQSLYLFRYPPKVMLRVRAAMPRIKAGNHGVEHERRFVVSPAQTLRIYHYPLRSKEHFIRKVINGAVALERNATATAGTGWHWRRWYAAYRDGRLDDEYRLLVLTAEAATELHRQGMVDEERQLRPLLFGYDHSEPGR